ncbi:MAG: C40 family peptidase, partial [Clostridiaceae bacterium]|nr:C40 family peptidase [Clostridiaceae bacterium]
ETVESEIELDKNTEKVTVMSRFRTHSDSMIRQISSSTGVLRIMPPATAVLVVLTVILHMTVGGGAALRPQDEISIVDNGVYELGDYESQPYLDSDFNRNANDLNFDSTMPGSTAEAAAETVSESSLETTVETTEPVVETTIETTESAMETTVETTVEATETTEETTDETTIEPVPEFKTVDQTLYLAANKVNLRSEPNTTCEILDIITLAEQLRRTEVSNEWSLVTTANGFSGYIMNKYLTESKPEPTPAPTPAPTPTPVPAPVQTIKQTPVITSPDSKISPEKQQEMVNLAKSFLGVRYQTPCNAPTTFDCSGFTRYIYQTMFGVDLPYTTYGQITKGISVNISLSDIQIGDIICFDWSYNGSCDHVGLYIGNNQIIDASNNAGKVRQKALNIESSPILSVRRIIY